MTEISGLRDCLNIDQEAFARRLRDAADNAMRREGRRLLRGQRKSDEILDEHHEPDPMLKSLLDAFERKYGRD